jgi:hypothetical protein
MCWWRHTFFGGSMAMGSFCAMLICTGFAESCLLPSLFMERRNCAAVSRLFARVSGRRRAILTFIVPPASGVASQLAAAVWARSA